MPKANSLINGLKNAPWVETFRAICQQATALLESPEQHSQLQSQDLTIGLEVYNISLANVHHYSDPQVIKTQLQRCVDRFPHFIAGKFMTSLKAARGPMDLETLLPNREVNDEIIRAILGFEYDGLNEQREKFHIVALKQEALNRQKRARIQAECYKEHERKAKYAKHGEGEDFECDLEHTSEIELDDERDGDARKEFDDNAGGDGVGLLDSDEDKVEEMVRIIIHPLRPPTASR